MTCVLCEAAGEGLVWQGRRLRVIRAQEAGFPAFYRVIWTAHVAEWSDLTTEERGHCMDAVVQVEHLLRERLQPTKINLATLGNVVPHLHWHVVARFDWDSRFPAPLWAAAQRPEHAARLSAVQTLLPGLDAELGRRLAQHFGNTG
jgi:diadenosine tetraphosphate (Ap4A) HIT family hydrolase